MASWVVRTITSPFRKAYACTFFNQQQQQPSRTPDHSKSHRSRGRGQEGREGRVMDVQLHGEVMACGYEDVQIMWSILDNSNPTTTSTSKDDVVLTS